MFRFAKNIANIAVCGTMVTTIALVGCSADDSGFDGGKSKSKPDPPAAAATVDASRNPALNVQQDCGLPPSNGTGSQQIFAESLSSLPVIVQGTNMGVGFTVTTNAQVNIQAMTDQSTQSISVSVANVQVSNNMLGIPLAIAKSKAEKAASAKSGTKTTAQVPRGEWLNIVSSTANPQFQGLFCAVSPTKTMTNNTGGSTAIVQYAPALTNTINPLASRATLDKELGTARPPMQVTATITGSRSDMPAGTLTGTITIAPIQPTLVVNGQSIASDVAYEITADFPGGSYKAGISRSQKFFLNTTTHTFEAIVDDSGQIDADSGGPLPPVILKRQ